MGPSGPGRSPAGAVRRRRRTGIPVFVVVRRSRRVGFRNRMRGDGFWNPESHPSGIESPVGWARPNPRLTSPSPRGGRGVLKSRDGRTGEGPPARGRTPRWALRGVRKGVGTHGRAVTVGRERGREARGRGAGGRGAGAGGWVQL